MLPVPLALLLIIAGVVTPAVPSSTIGMSLFPVFYLSLNYYHNTAIADCVSVARGNSDWTSFESIKSWTVECAATRQCIAVKIYISYFIV